MREGPNALCLHQTGSFQNMPMSTVRQYRFCAKLGFNLSSLLEAPQIGRQTFTVTEISTSEPDPSFFQPPQGYRVVDHRKGSDVE